MYDQVYWVAAIDLMSAACAAMSKFWQNGSAPRGLTESSAPFIWRAWVSVEVASMSEAHIDDAILPRKINIGCGFDIRPGYLNVDSGEWHNPDLIADVTGMPMLPSGHFEEAVAQDVLEHIGRTKQVATLSEWSRLLCQGGLLHVRVPSVVDMVRMLEQPDFRNSVEQQHFWVQMLYGTQAYPGDFHLCGYTCATLADLGRQAGLFLSSLTIKDRWLFDSTFRKVSGTDDLTNREFVIHQYVTILERVPDVDGLTHWASQVESGAVLRAELVQAFQSARFNER